MRTPSLRRRAVLTSLATLACLLLAVGVFVDLTLGTLLKTEQRVRVASLAALATRLQGTLGDQDLADRLSVPGVLVTIRGDAGTVVGVPAPPTRAAPPPRPAPAAAVPRVQDRDGRIIATQRITGGGTLVLSADTRPIDATLARFRVVMAAGSIGALLIAGLLLRVVLGRALQPLHALTESARATARGDRGRRLTPRDPHTDLGRAATEFDAMLEELEGAEHAARQARERLGAFLSDAAHELRTPLAAISAGAEHLLLDSADPAASTPGAPESHEVLAGVVRETRRAGRLVDDLLTVSRLGQLSLLREPVDIRALAAAAAARVSSRVEVIAPRPTPSFSGDRMRLEQVLANLLGNARAAAPDGRTRVRVTPAGPHVAMVVSDDGPGVALADRGRIFERLVRLDPSRSTAGAGLGLPIARGLVEAHGGRLTCIEPEAGDLPGAAFRIELPIAPEAELDAAELDSAELEAAAVDELTSAVPA